MLQGGIATDLQGHLWYKGLSGSSDPGIDQVLTKFGAAREVVGHLDSGAAILPGFGNKVIFIDVGLTRVRDNAGAQACLVIEKDKLYALHRGNRLDLPKDDRQDMLRYLKQAAALDPEPSPLAGRIEKLEASLATR
jgi:hypothetical protein